MGHASELLERADAYLRTSVAPRATEIDEDPAELQKALRGLCELGVMALKRPEQYGGPELDEASFRAFQESVARYSGSLAFLQTQHQSAVSMIARGSNAALKQEYLPQMADGQKLLGIGFSQLRRAGPPIMRAEVSEGGYLLDGEVPWVTGLDFYPEFLIGAQLPDGSALFGIVPLGDFESEKGSIKTSEPMKLAAMQSANTVSAEIRNWHLDESRVVDIKPAGWIHSSDQINIVLQAYFALGGARAGLDILRTAYEKRQAAFLLKAWEALDAEIGRCRSHMEEAQRKSGEATTEEKLALRAWAIDLAVRCAHAAIAASGGSANDVRHPAQRVYREALVYTVSAQTPAIMEATIERLIGRSS